MRVAMISCWFKNQLYSDYAQGLRSALEESLQTEVDLITGDCLCACRRNSHFANLVDDRCKSSKLSYLPNPHGRLGKFAGVPRKFGRDWRIGRSYLELASGADVIHFQEVTHGFGTIPALSFLAAPSNKRRVVTIHELERFTQRGTSLYKLYNRADALIVHSRLLKEALAELGVDERLIHVVPFGARTASVVPDSREGIVYYGGHHLFSGKGFDDFLGALHILAQRGERVKASVFGYFTESDLQSGRSQAARLGLRDQIIWFNHPARATYQDLFSRSAVAVIPYTGGSAAFPASLALACGTPTVATRKVELPEYLGLNALYVEPNSPVQIARALSRFLENGKLRQQHSERLLERARRTCDWDAVVQRTLHIYRGDEVLLDPDPWHAPEVSVGTVG